MSLFRRLFVPGFLGVLGVVGSLGCGGSTNNDQGTSLLANGYFAPGTTPPCTTGLAGLIAALATDVPSIVAQAGTGLISVQGDGNIAIVDMLIENRLSSQFVRIDRIDCTYDVPGADPSLRIPGDTFASSGVIAPSPGFAVSPSDVSGVSNSGSPATSSSSSSSGTSSSSSSSSSGTAGATGSTLCMGMAILSPDLFSFLNVNRNLLPELPFRLIASCKAVGISQAGDVFETNPLRLFVQFVDVSECCTSAGTGNGNPPGFQNGSGTGGDFDSFGGTTSSSGSTGTVEEGVTAEGQLEGEGEEGEEGDSTVSDDDFVIE